MRKQRWVYLVFLKNWNIVAAHLGHGYERKQCLFTLGELCSFITFCYATIAMHVTVHDLHVTH